MAEINLNQLSPGD